MKKLLYLVLVMLVGISLASCNKKKSNNDPEYDDTEYTMSLSTNSVEVVVGNSITVTATVDPSPKTSPIWTVDYNEAYVTATIEDGVCTIHGVGKISSSKVTISCSVNQYTTLTETLNVKVVENGVIVKKSGNEVVAPGSTLQIKIGNTMQFSAELAKPLSGATTKWESSNPSVATVSNDGLVTTLKGGETTITATIAVGGMSFSCSFKVEVIDVLRVYLKCDGHSMDGQDVSGKTISLEWLQKATLEVNVKKFDRKIGPSVSGIDEKTSYSEAKMDFTFKLACAETKTITFTAGDQTVVVTAKPKSLPMGELRIKEGGKTLSLDNLSGHFELSNWKDLNISDIVWQTVGNKYIDFGGYMGFNNPITNGPTVQYDIVGYAPSITVTATWGTGDMKQEASATFTMNPPSKMSVGYQKNTDNYMRTYVGAGNVLLTGFAGANEMDSRCLEWSSANTAVATVDNGSNSSTRGTVKIVGLGSTTIKATCGSKTATFYLDVVPHFFASRNVAYFLCPTNVEHKYGETNVYVKDYTTDPTLWVASKEENALIGKTGAPGHVMDLFGWGAIAQSGEAIEQYQNSSSSKYNYGSVHPKEGAKIGKLQHACEVEELSKGEWEFLLNTRTMAAGARYYTVKCDGKAMLLLPPDNWENSTAVALKSGNTYTAAQIQTLAQSGMVCLPAGFTRDGQSVSTSSDEGWYWTSSMYDTENAYALRFTSSKVEVVGDKYRRRGYYSRCAVPLPYVGSK